MLRSRLMFVLLVAVLVALSGCARGTHSVKKKGNSNSTSTAVAQRNGKGKSAPKARATDDEIIEAPALMSSAQMMEDAVPLTTEASGTSAPITTKDIRTPRKTRLYEFGPTKPGQNLVFVATELLPSEKVTVSQMMWALYQKNPEAFANRDINGLKANQVLSIPEIDEVLATSKSAAESEIARLRSSRAAAKTKSAAL